MIINIVKVTFTLHWPDGKTQVTSRQMLDHDVEWAAQMFIEENELTKVECEFNGEHFTVEKA